MRLFRLPRRAIARLGPYPALILVGLPLMVVEPLKLATIFIIGEGHWITGAVAIIVAYAVSLLVLERLFRIVKPKLLSLPWFAVLWTWFVASRRKLTNKIGVAFAGAASYPKPSAQATKRRPHATPLRASGIGRKLSRSRAAIMRVGDVKQRCSLRHCEERQRRRNPAIAVSTGLLRVGCASTRNDEA